MKNIALFLPVFLLSLLYSYGAHGASNEYVVLFKDFDQQISKTASKANREIALKNQNLAKISQLRTWLSRYSKSQSKILDLWLIAGVVLDLNDQEAKDLEGESWILQVRKNQRRVWIEPKDFKETPQDQPWGLNFIGLNQVREQHPELTGDGIKVGILDTGIQSGHPEFGASKGIHFKDFVNEIGYPYDDHGHGTHVAGTIAGQTVGIAPQVEIFAGKIFTAQGSGFDSMIIKGMQWMFDPDNDPNTNDGPTIVSNSWGLGVPQGIYTFEDFLVYHRAVQTWVQGGLFPIFAAGNSGEAPNGIPGGFPESIAIGAVDPAGDIAWFSSKGPNFWFQSEHILSLFKPDFSAPGVNTLSAIPNNTYGSMSGTSMATPHMAGSRARALQVSPDLSLAQAKLLLLNSSTPRHDLNFGHGILNLAAMISQLQGSTE